MSTSGSGGRQNNNYVNKQNQPQRNTDAKTELELCRVSLEHSRRAKKRSVVKLKTLFFFQRKSRCSSLFVLMSHMNP